MYDLDWRTSRQTVWCSDINSSLSARKDYSDIRGWYCHVSLQLLYLSHLEITMQRTSEDGLHGLSISPHIPSSMNPSRPIPLPSNHLHRSSILFLVQEQKSREDSYL